MAEEKNSDGMDLLIPYHGQYKLVRELIGSIVLYTRNIPYRITIIDDCSENASYFSTLAQLDTIDGVRLEKQSGFGAAVNKGVSLTKRPWIVILNSDVVINEMNWLKNLYDSLLKLNKSDRVGLVTARADDPPGTHPLLKSEKDSRHDIGDQVSTQPVPLFCAIMARKVFETCGPLKEYPYGWYEDEEFYWRMRKHGYNQGISGKAWVRHVGGSIGATTKELWAKNPSIKETMENNRLRCLADLKTLFGR